MQVNNVLKQEQDQEITRLKLALTAEHEAALSTSKERLIRDRQEEIQRAVDVRVRTKTAYLLTCVCEK